MVSDEALKKLQEQIAAWPMTQRFVVQQHPRGGESGIGGDEE